MNAVCLERLKVRLSQPWQLFLLLALNLITSVTTTTFPLWDQYSINLYIFEKD